MEKVGTYTVLTRSPSILKIKLLFLTQVHDDALQLQDHIKLDIFIGLTQQILKYHTLTALLQTGGPHSDLLLLL